jgi:DNA invertase Pin-like site-specific DNA recombinase
MNKYVIAKYIRLSVDDGITESLSIPNQRLILDRHIDSLEIPNAEILEFVDNGHSGVNMERPAVQRLIDLVRSAGVNMICVKDFSRFSRNAMDSGYFIEQVFPLYGIRFISVSDHFDSNDYKNDTGGIDVAFKFLMHEYYSKDLSLKTKSALRIKQINGEHVNGNIAYGFRSDGKKKIEPDPETADTVRLIFKMALEGYSMAEIRKALFQGSHPTPKEYSLQKKGKDVAPKCRWKTETIVRILRDEQYTGTYIGGKKERIAVGMNRTVETDPSKWIEIQDNHPAIVSREDFDLVQRTAMIKGTRAVKENSIGKTGQKRVKKDGSAIAIHPLYGYVFDEKRKPKINQQAAEAIRKIFQMTIDGKTISQICETLTQAGFPTPGEQKAMDRGEEVCTKKAWTRGTVNNILRELQYTGTAVSQRSVTVAKTKAGEPKPMLPRISPQSEWRLTPNARPAIISEETFDKAQEILMNKPKNKGEVRNYLLKYVGKCGICGLALGYDNNAGYPLYRCDHTIYDPKAACYKMKFVAREIDDAVIEVVKKQAEVVLNCNSLEKLRLKTDIEKQASDCEKQIEQCNEQRQKLYERFVLCEITRAEYLELKSGCSADIEKLSKQMAAFRAEARAKDADMSMMVLAKRIASGTMPHKEIVDTLVEKIYVFPDKRIEIVWKIADFTAK